ncbi:MAG: hypothetical protein JRH16_20810 [Deltaproteobacteria bacterium]|nr:hypothetical protein [Deltaproteobacteria bacterium]
MAREILHDVAVRHEPDSEIGQAHRRQLDEQGQGGEDLRNSGANEF